MFLHPGHLSLPSPSRPGTVRSCAAHIKSCWVWSPPGHCSPRSVPLRASAFPRRAVVPGGWGPTINVSPRASSGARVPGAGGLPSFCPWSSPAGPGQALLSWEPPSGAWLSSDWPHGQSQLCSHGGHAGVTRGALHHLGSQGRKRPEKLSWQPLSPDFQLIKGGHGPKDRAGHVTTCAS